MASSTEICNIAISHIGVGKEIGNLETEKSAEAAACRRFYNTARDEILTDAEWYFTSKTVTLGLVEKDPTTEWYYSYRYPSDCLFFRRIFSGLDVDNRQTKVPYVLFEDSSGILIYTNCDQAVGEYTFRNENVNQYPSKFVLALSYLLAFYIAPRLTAGDPFKLRKEMWDAYQFKLSQAKSLMSNEQQNYEQPQAEWIRVRNGGNVSFFDRYKYDYY